MPPEAGQPTGDAHAHLARQWLEKSRHDLLAADRAAQPEQLPDVAVYHSQQAAEKALKGYLALHGQPFQRTHDLVQLMHLCRTLDATFQQLLPAAEALAPYAIEPRYPGEEHSDPTVREMEDARRDAQLVVDFVLQRVPPDVHP